MEAGDIVQDILDRLEGAIKEQERAKAEASEAKGRAFHAEYDAKQAKTEAEGLRAALRCCEARLEAALRLLDSDGRVNYEAAINPPKTDADGEVIPF
ncbi:hypothetical protein [Azospirillum picis]|uniref:Component of type VI protein secretion system n=1 Tax=Azospirillum picis TaxID=488438 RepID=A0ABU0MQH1_9PROT|nr:hypothetical protein [Azospirillum picis]MBP2301534.1 putative component of type VI protein secretion system [Azospirillum picis]MDQ0535366.1 putative component of type VI protein secretion system [Azospirillum picis]